MFTLPVLYKRGIDHLLVKDMYSLVASVLCSFNLLYAICSLVRLEDAPVKYQRCGVYNNTIDMQVVCVPILSYFTSDCQ